MGTLDRSHLSTDPKAHPPFPELSHLHDRCLANMDFRELLKFYFILLSDLPQNRAKVLFYLLVSS